MWEPFQSSQLYLCMIALKSIRQETWCQVDTINRRISNTKQHIFGCQIAVILEKKKRKKERERKKRQCYPMIKRKYQWAEKVLLWIESQKSLQKSPKIVINMHCKDESFPFCIKRHLSMCSSKCLKFLGQKKRSNAERKKKRTVTNDNEDNEQIKSGENHAKI